jgi:hypothetical protein
VKVTIGKESSDVSSVIDKVLDHGIFDDDNPVIVSKHVGEIVDCECPGETDSLIENVDITDNLGISNDDTGDP